MKEFENLEQLGWTPFFSQQMTMEQLEQYQPARVLAEHRGAFRIHHGATELWAECTGKMYHQATSKGELPAVGDWVAIQRVGTQERASICWVLERKSKFSRKSAGELTSEQIVAANVDTLFLVNALDLDFNLRRLERYLVLAWESGATPVVLLSKSDACDDVERRIEEVESIAYGVPIHPVSGLQSTGLEELSGYLSHGNTIALIGSSGVGKSTLLNALIGQEVQKVKQVRGHDHRGQHTTTSRQLFMIPHGGMMIDTPGMREIQLWNGHAGLQQTFDDLEMVMSRCKFRDCQHQAEPGCAVHKAIEAGDLDPQRFVSYLKLQRELAFLERKQNARVRSEEEKRWKQITVASRRRRLHT